MTPVPVILDVDTGVDDACALLLAALHPEVELRAVTCVSGNVCVDDVVRNTLKVLDVAGRPDVPVARGAARPLLAPVGEARHVHGHDGMADLGWPSSGRHLDGRHAVELLRDLLSQAAQGGPDGRITLVPLAPLTNIALLLRTFPEAAAGLREIVFMGGATQGGNATASAEFNVWHDPEAAAIVLASAAELDIPVVMYGLDVFYDVRVSRAQAAELIAVGGRGPAELAGRLVDFQCGRFGGPDATIGDAGAVCAVIDRAGLRTTRLPVRVELAGASRGRTIVDHRDGSGDSSREPHGLAPTSVAVALSVDADRYAQLWLRTVTGPEPGTGREPSASQRAHAPWVWPCGRIASVNPSTALATVVVDELVRHGVREAVLCPGSRSAPFAYALQDADRAGRLRLHVRVDERSAAFLALGMAKLTRRPVPVFTTSGTAVANLHPAVLEASHAAVPLIIVSADRPAELRRTGANQTTDQGHLFGNAIRMFHQLGAPESRVGQNAMWRSVVARLCAAALGASGSDAGPVHLNVPLREPLVPDLASDGEWPESLEGRDDAAPWVRVHPSGTRVDGVACVPRTLVLLGDLPDPGMAVEVIALARAAGWPVVAEPFGAHDRRDLVPHGPLILTDVQWLERHLPDRVLVVGRVTLSRALGALLRNPAVKVEIVAAQTNWPDPSHVSSVVHPFEALAASLPHSWPVDERWARGWADAGELVAKAAGSIIEQAWPSGLTIAATVLAALPSEATLFVGSSNSARDVDLAMSPFARRAPLTVVASRGLAGIDGCVSTAIGLALAQPRRPAYALMGDLTFLHDSNGLLIGPHEPKPGLTVVVTNDDGGGIFTLLEPGEPCRATDFERIFGTPTGASIADICRAHGVRHTLASTAAELSGAVGQPPEGLHVVEVRVDRSGHRELHAALRSAAANAVR